MQESQNLVVITTVAEGVDVGNIRRCNIFGILAVDLYDLTPCIISICGCQLAGGGIGKGYYIALQIVEIVIDMIAAVRHGDAVALLVVEEAKRLAVGRLGKYLRAVEKVACLNAVNGFARADTLGVVGKLQALTVF